MWCSPSRRGSSYCVDYRSAQSPPACAEILRATLRLWDGHPQAMQFCVASTATRLHRSVCARVDPQCESHAQHSTPAGKRACTPPRATRSCSFFRLAYCWQAPPLRRGLGELMGLSAEPMQACREYLQVPGWVASGHTDPRAHIRPGTSPRCRVCHKVASTAQSVHHSVTRQLSLP